jgi:hypothetical protein
MHELQQRNVSRNILFFKSLNALKMSRNWGSKFKKASLVCNVLMCAGVLKGLKKAI